MALDGRGEIGLDGEEVNFDVTVMSNPNGADVAGAGLWKMTAFLASSDDGQGPRDVLDQQVLSSADASRDMTAGGRMRFQNLASQVSQEDINCEEGTFMCVELQQGDAANPMFSMNPREGAGTAPFIDCTKLRCAKPGRCLIL